MLQVVILYSAGLCFSPNYVMLVLGSLQSNAPSGISTGRHLLSSRIAFGRSFKELGKLSSPGGNDDDSFGFSAVVSRVRACTITL